MEETTRTEGDLQVLPELNLEAPESINVDPPTYELTAEELVFPVGITEENEDYAILVHMKPYTARSCKELLAGVGVKMKLGAENLFLSDSTPAYKFFWSNFRGLSEIEFEPGTPPTPDQAKKFIQDNPRYRFEEQTVLRGYGGIGIEYSPDPPSKKFQISKSKRVVKTFFTLYQEGEIQKIIIKHYFNQESEFDFRQYNQATARSKVTKKNEWMKVEDYAVVEQIYNRLIKTVDGYRIDGEPTTEDNKEEWVKLVPFWHKHFVLQEYFKGVQVKNVR